MSTLRMLAIVVLFVWIIIDAAIVIRRKTNQAENRDRSSLKVLAIAGPLVWLVSISLAFSAWGVLRSIESQVVGLSLMAIGIVVRSTAIAQLGRLHTPNVAIRDDHQLMETGLYRYVRHPSYLGALIAFVGFSLALSNWLSALVIVAVTPWLYLYRINEEEAALSAGLGEPYRAYCRRTKRLIPGLY